MIPHRSSKSESKELVVDTDSWMYLSAEQVEQIKGYAKSLLGAIIILCSGFILVAVMNAAM